MQLSAQFDSFNGVQNHHYTSLSKYLDSPTSNVGKSLAVKRLTEHSQLTNPEQKHTRPYAYVANLPSLPVSASLACRKSPNCSDGEFSDVQSTSSNFPNTFNPSSLGYRAWPKIFPITSEDYVAPGLVSSCVSTARMTNTAEKVSKIHPGLTHVLYNSLTSKGPSSLVNPNLSDPSIAKVSLVNSTAAYSFPKLEDHTKPVYNSSVSRISTHPVKSPHEYSFPLKEKLARPQGSSWNYQLCELKKLHLEENQDNYQSPSADTSKKWLAGEAFNCKSNYDSSVTSHSTDVYKDFTMSSSCIYSGTSDTSPYKTARDRSQPSYSINKSKEIETKEEKVEDALSKVFLCPRSANSNASPLSLKESCCDSVPHFKDFDDPVGSVSSTHVDSKMSNDSKKNAVNTISVSCGASNPLKSITRSDVEKLSVSKNNVNEKSMYEATTPTNGAVLAFNENEALCNDSGHITSNISIKVRSVISEWKAGTIIGRQGCSINDLRQKYRCKITISSDTTHADRILTVVGPWPRVACAFAKICSILTSGSTTELHHNSKTATASREKLNHGGESRYSPSITESKASPAMNFVSSQDCDKKSPNCLNAQSLVDAKTNKKKFCTSALLLLSSSSSSCYPPSVVSTMLEVFDLGKDDVVFPNTFTFVLSIPSSQCGCLIGKGGGQIRELRQKFFVSFNVAPISSYHSLQERLISISGAVENVAWCLTEVCRLLSISLASSPSAESFSTETESQSGGRSKAGNKQMSLSGFECAQESKLSLPYRVSRLQPWKPNGADSVEPNSSHVKESQNVVEKQNLNGNNKQDVLLTDSIECTGESETDTLTLNNLKTSLLDPLPYTFPRNPTKCDASKGRSQQKAVQRVNALQVTNGLRRNRLKNQHNAFDSIPRYRHTSGFNGTQSDELCSGNVEEYSYTLPSGEVEVHLRVPNDIVGCIIGKGGKTISEIRSTTETFISITEIVSSSLEYSNKTISRQLYPTRSAAQKLSPLASSGTRRRSRIICIRGQANNVRTARFLMGSSILSAQKNTGQSNALKNLPPLSGVRSTVAR